MTVQTPLVEFRFDPDPDAGFDAAFIAIEITRLLREGRATEVGEFVDSLELADAAALLEELAEGDDLDVMRMLPLHDQAEIIGYLRPRAQGDARHAHRRDAIWPS